MTFLYRRAGWVRLWVMVCLIAAGFFVTYKAEDFPMKSPIIEGLETSMSITLGDMMLRSSTAGKTATQVQAELDAWKAKRKQDTEAELAALPGEQFKYIALWTGAWIALCIALRLAGEILGWVIRGFFPR